MNSEIIPESESYKGKSNYGFSFKDICLKQVQRIADLGSKEWKQGFYVHSRPAPNMSSEVVKYVGDTRKEYINGIDVLHDLLLAKFDKEIKTESKKIQEKIDVVKKAQHPEGLTDLLHLSRLMYQELCLFLERLGWLESSTTEE